MSRRPISRWPGRMLWLTLLFSFSPAVLSPSANSFREQQLKFPRVRTASREKDEALRQRFKEKGLTYPPRAILLRAFKQEAVLELWVKDTDNKPFVLVHEYRICTSSGTLGPKRRFGDEQVPEGFYELDWFNPQSNFFLSLHISYPNASDRILGSRQNPGGDIFLHGNCASIGCIPITDDGIKEVYWLAALVHNQHDQHLPIEIFPARLTRDGMKALAAAHANQPELIKFWSNLKEGYDYFEKEHRLPRVKTRADGSYVFSVM
ncbi:MAG TPA: L,D-transpeptidase family protein [Candidatus Acidoferrum sp.]|nr:L,D-transpeptidase family protein [Candidatus Acidoferrum sp.]